MQSCSKDALAPPIGSCGPGTCPGKARDVGPEDLQRDGLENGGHGEGADQAGDVRVGPPRKGRKASRSSTMPIRPAAATASAAQAREKVRIHQREGDESGHCEDSGMGQVQDVEDAEHQRVPTAKSA